MVEELLKAAEAPWPEQQSSGWVPMSGGSQQLGDQLYPERSTGSGMFLEYPSSQKYRQCIAPAPKK